MFLQFPLFGLILHCCICVCFVIYKIYMLVFDYTSCRMDKLYVVRVLLIVLMVIEELRNICKFRSMS